MLELRFFVFPQFLFWQKCVFPQFFSKEKSQADLKFLGGVPIVSAPPLLFCTHFEY